MNNILITINETPYPPYSGGKVDFFYKLKVLKELGYNIYLIYSYSSEENNQLFKKVSNQYIEKFVSYPRKKSLKSVLSFIPYFIISNVPNSDEKKQIDNMLKDINIDVILIDHLNSFLIGEYITFKYPHAKLIHRMHNDEAVFLYSVFKTFKITSPKKWLFGLDALPYDEFTIENIIEIFEDKKVGAAYGRQLSYEGTNLFGKHLRKFNYGEASYTRNKNDISKYGIKTAFLSDSFACYRKSALESIRWFKSDLILGEDTYAGAKMILSGYKLAYVAEAKVYHSHSYTVWQEFKRYFDIGVFHKCESWILESFGKAEGEGMKYIKSEINYLLKNGAWYLLPEWFIRNGMKYLGYKLGQKYEKLPMWMIKKFSMYHRWWDKRRKLND